MTDEPLKWDEHDLAALRVLEPMLPRYVPWARHAMRPGAVLALLNDIALHGRQSIVECGSGLSTLYIARLLAERGGHLSTVEHDAIWLEWVRGELMALDLLETVTLVHAPLTPSTVALEDQPWYAEDVLRRELTATEIDLLVVDGPPAYAPGADLARYPAVPFFRERLAPDSTVFLDDAEREGETNVLTRWTAELGFPFARRGSGSEFALGGAHRRYDVYI